MERGIVAVVGRPNVGKSTLFNYLIGQRLSIVDSTPGVTRDRVYADVEWLGRSFVMIDTGGLEPHSKDPLLKQMRRQSEFAMDMADVILFLVDGRDGLQPADEAIANLLRRSGKPIVLGVNKLDNPGDPPPEFYDFYGLGFEDIFPISSSHGLGMGDLLDAICAKLPEDDDSQRKDDIPRIAIIGRPNTGKSSLLNQLAGQERAIVTDVAGTTRDAVEERIEYNGKPYIIVDTAGMRRKARVHEAIEYYSVVRGNKAIERSDVAILLIDAAEGPTEQDTKIAGLAINQGKPVILCVNKWDLEEKATETKDDFTAELRRQFAFMPWAKHVYISALTTEGIKQLMQVVDQVYEASQRKIRTSVLNDFIWEAQALQPPASDKGRRLKIRYSTQVSTAPPTFLFFLNDRKLLSAAYERYLENAMRRNFDLEGTPIRFILRQQSPRQEEKAREKRLAAQEARQEEARQEADSQDDGDGFEVDEVAMHNE